MARSLVTADTLIWSHFSNDQVVTQDVFISQPISTASFFQDVKITTYINAGYFRINAYWVFSALFGAVWFSGL
ncbi:predicted protein [Sclerotinia sclerotiorum 1980 UF-70]|uniref:Uncharacterized protein n=1 Tax=Sclerotinia sclerotiorum (strain ATCC 18683 / 1980 / Ss-1) TaxID=665079 RepID=A7F0I5_SCLS1|nr:predicted protein [Sclerotinia sclerotiorum 1980 UF-70]EDN95227.1 predicted protein [Sclerotinia sclerotiorum 1980 UF-70]